MLIDTMGQVLLSASLLAGEFLWRTLPFMVLGVLAAEFIVALGVVNKISFIARPITKFSHLRKECGASFVLVFGSPAAANSMLAEYHEKGNEESNLTGFDCHMSYCFFACRLYSASTDIGINPSDSGKP